MPELVEVEVYRRAAGHLVGAEITSVRGVDGLYCAGDLTPRRLSGALRGERITGARRHGKLLLVDTTGPVVGLRFGMTGVLEVDGASTLGDLVYGPTRRDPRWLRLTLVTTGGVLAVRDPRRLGSVALDPDASVLGPDAATVGLAALRGALGDSATPVKARLMDQHHLAGVGNLIADEVLWRASLRPTRRAGSLSETEVRRLHRHLRSTIADLLERGGSHQGRLMAERRPGGRCPRDHVALQRSTVGGRTSWWCPAHQH